MRNLKPRVVVADDHPDVLAAVVQLLISNDCDVVAAVQDGDDAVHRAIDLTPDVIVLDISMPRMNGLAAGREIRRIGLSLKIVFLTIQSEPEFVERTLGAAYVLKSRLHSDLLPAIAEMLGERFPSRQSVLVSR